MQNPHHSPGEEAGATLSLQPLRGSGTEQWTLRLEDDLLTLTSPEGRVVMMLPQSDAARRLRFERDLFKGRVVSFCPGEGLRAYDFRCNMAILQTLLGWLPKRSPEGQARETRYYGAAMVILGTVLLLFPAHFAPWLGVGAILAGLVSLVLGGPELIALHGLWCLVMAAWLLFGELLLGRGATASAEARVLDTGLGAVLLLWAIQQFSLLGPRQRLTAARRHLVHEETKGEMRRSRLVRTVAMAALAMAAPLALHTAGLLIGYDAPAPGVVNPLILHAVPMLVLIGSAAILFLRKTPAYMEARLTAQFAVVLLVLYVCGWIQCLLAGESAFPAGALVEGLGLITRLYIWAPIVLGVALLNRWYLRRMDLELQREQD